MTELTSTLAEEIVDWLSDALDGIADDSIDDSTLHIVFHDRRIRLCASVVRGEPEASPLLPARADK